MLVRVLDPKLTRSSMRIADLVVECRGTKLMLI